MCLVNACDDGYLAPLRIKNRLSNDLNCRVLFKPTTANVQTKKKLANYLQIDEEKIKVVIYFNGDREFESSIWPMW